jgi:hypothetical protein
MGLVPQCEVAQKTRSQEADVLKPATIRARLLVCFVLVALVPVLAISLASLAVVYYTRRRQVSDRLEFPTALKQSSIEGWIHD